MYVAERDAEQTGEVGEGCGGRGELREVVGGCEEGVEIRWD